ncbi:MAG TPA: hypothetical protein VFV67_21390 [Actinophytocola sp.]|uniref:hypothetical protein n=1 Tax=Actinophytocola sp. TaxID=1872138 RepID=UPI002DBBE3AB|nr:hypothetical protein [Actinophytocola sp.]HEU5473206.1 hypothetical protein [Actinophytocola sp.]
MSPTRRVAVMSPQTRHAHARGRLRGRWRLPTLEPRDADRAVVIFQAQRRLAVAPLVLLFAGMLGLPLVFRLFPGLDQLRLAGIPVSWLALAVLPYPALVLLARWQLRRAERVEDER